MTPKYSYVRHMNKYKLYNENGDKIYESYDEEEVRKKCYELNGWKYKEKSPAIK